MKNLKKAQTGIHYIKYQYKPFKIVRKNKERLGNYPKETWGNKFPAWSCPELGGKKTAIQSIY